MELSIFAKGYIEGFIQGASDYGGIIINEDSVTLPAKVFPPTEDNEIYRLKELLCVIRECAVSNFDDRAVKLAGKGIEDDFHIPLLRFKEILKSL